MADVDEDFNIKIEGLSELITESTKAIIPVDFAGYPCDYDSIFDIVTSSEIVDRFRPANSIQKNLGRMLVLSDAAHSIGAKYKGRSSGSLADITVFSLHAVKNVTTAEGGAICITLPESFKRNEVFNRMKLMSLNGQTKDAFTKNRAGDWKYDIILDGYKMNMPDICATIGLVQIHKYKDFLLPLRKLVANRFNDAFKKMSWAILPTLAKGNTESSYHIYPLRIKDITEKERDRIIELISKNEVAVNVHFIPLPMLTFFKEIGYCIDDYPVSYKNYSCEISLPIYPQLKEADIDLIITSVVESYNKVKKDV